MKHVLLFLKLFAPFALVMWGVFALLDRAAPWHEGLVAALMAAAVFGLAITLLDAFRGGGVARDGVRIAREATVPVPPDHAYARYLDAVRSLPGVRSLEADPAAGTIRARTGFTWTSFGERITVRIRGDEDASRVTVSSVPRQPLTVVDYGKNRENVEHIHAAFEPPDRVPAGVARVR